MLPLEQIDWKDGQSWGIEPVCYKTEGKVRYEGKQRKSALRTRELRTISRGIVLDPSSKTT